MKRGIEFQFSIDEWVEWWEKQLGLDWQKLRGRSAGKYVMARKGDKGPYHPDNVECVTGENNTKEAVKHGLSTKGTRHGMCKLNEEQAKFIKYNLQFSAMECAKMFGVSRPICSLIREGKRWTHI